MLNVSRYCGLAWRAGGADYRLVRGALFGRDAAGWHWATGDLLNELLQWRWPRIFAALIAGVMLAVAGALFSV
jgi:ABC-type Fe3+-siderophore transport system permease subunit